MDTLIATLNEKLPNGFEADPTRVKKDRLCDTCQRVLKGSTLLHLPFDSLLISNSERLEHSTVGKLIQSALAGCHLCNLIFAEADGEGRPERTSLTQSFLIELKLTQRNNWILLGIDVLSLPVRPIQDRGYSHGSLKITLQRGSSQRAELESICPAEEQERGTAFVTTLMMSSLHKTTSSISSKNLARIWLSDCLTRHEQCSSVAAFDRILPSRLLHMSTEMQQNRLGSICGLK
jgi:hypothetical protein